MLSHVDDSNRPQMVNVTEKQATVRTARARAIIVLPEEAAAQFSGGDLQTKKGPVFQTAIIAGTMAAKKTGDLIPLCHPLGLEDCTITAELEGNEVIIECTARLEAKTGVEMEALTGATVAALTVYDMCKALTHGIVIKDVRLMEKTGGKRDYRVRE